MVMKDMQVYVVRDNTVSVSSAHDAVIRAFKEWAEPSQDFNCVRYVAMYSGDSVPVNLYPEQEVEGFWFKERGPDEVQSPSPFVLELHELSVSAEVVPAECSIVAFIGPQTMEQYGKHDIDYAIEQAWCGCDIFEVAEIADDCDGFVGLYRSTINAASNLPDTGFDSAEVHVSNADNIALLINLNRAPEVSIKIRP